MNYRHAFHAGNFADCLKHAALVWLLRAMARKPGGFLYLDTHAGIGRYDLSDGPALRTGEWRAGIGRLRERPDPALADYLAQVESLGLYPGSPVLARALLRRQDRMVACELHPEDYRSLRLAFLDDAQVAIHKRDAWEALGAFLPPPERRGLVLIDPPYEAEDEFDRLAEGLRTAWRRFPTGVFAAWYPIKHRAPVRAFDIAVREAGLRDVVAAELALRAPLDPARLNGCGLLVVNPPFRFEVEVPPILAALLAGLGTGEPGAYAGVERLVDE
jgi:23S rRNA (adenine2030-N6)-methyltransferase